MDGFDSKILSNEPSNFSKTLGEWLPKAKNWTACWRATRDGWAASTFRSNCDGKVPTLIIVKVVKDSKNLIFGGYSTVTWTGNGKFEFMIIYIYYRYIATHHSSALSYGPIDRSVHNLIIATTWSEITDIIYFYFYTFCFPNYFKVFL